MQTRLPNTSTENDSITEAKPSLSHDAKIHLHNICSKILTGRFVNLLLTPELVSRKKQDFIEEILTDNISSIPLRKLFDEYDNEEVRKECLLSIENYRSVRYKEKKQESKKRTHNLIHIELELDQHSDQNESSLDSTSSSAKRARITNTKLAQPIAHTCTKVLSHRLSGKTVNPALLETTKQQLRDELNQGQIPRSLIKFFNQFNHANILTICIEAILHYLPRSMGNHASRWTKLKDVPYKITSSSTTEPDQEEIKKDEPDFSDLSFTEEDLREISKFFDNLEESTESEIPAFAPLDLEAPFESFLTPEEDIVNVLETVYPPLPSLPSPSGTPPTHKFHLFPPPGNNNPTAAKDDLLIDKDIDTSLIGSSPTFG